MPKKSGKGGGKVEIRHPSSNMKASGGKASSSTEQPRKPKKKK